MDQEEEDSSEEASNDIRGRRYGHFRPENTQRNGTFGKESFQEVSSIAVVVMTSCFNDL